MAPRLQARLPNCTGFFVLCIGFFFVKLSERRKECRRYAEVMKRRTSVVGECKRAAAF